MLSTSNSLGLKDALTLTRTADMLVGPSVLEPADGGGREATRVLAEQGGQRLLEVA